MANQILFTSVRSTSQQGNVNGFKVTSLAEVSEPSLSAQLDLSANRSHRTCGDPARTARVGLASRSGFRPRARFTRALPPADRSELPERCSNDDENDEDDASYACERTVAACIFSSDVQPRRYSLFPFLPLLPCSTIRLSCYTAHELSH